MEYDVLDALAGDLKNSIVEEQDIAKHEKENFAIPIDSCDNLLYFDSREPTRIHSDRSTQFQ